MDSDSTSDGRTHSVTRWIEQLKQGDPEAAQKIWERYIDRLLPLARAKLKSLRDKSVDENDILNSVFHRLIRAAEQNRYSRLDDRDDLWQILLDLTEKRIVSQYRRAHAKKRGGGKTVQAVDLPPFDMLQICNMADPKANPELLAAFNECLKRAIASLPPGTVREVAILKFQGYLNREIAAELGVATVTVERKLRVIRKAIRREFADEP